MRPLAGLVRIGARPWSLVELVGRVEASGLPWQLQEVPGRVLVGVGAPVRLEGHPARGPGFVASEFFAGGELLVRSYPLVVSVRGAATGLFGLDEAASEVVAALDTQGAPCRGRGLEVARWPRVPAEVCDQVASAREAILQGRVDKLVVATRLEVPLEGELSLAEALRGLGRAHPASMRCCADGWCGASPELVVAKDGRRVSLRPLAGTASPEGAEALLASMKDQIEHRLMVDQLVEDLGPLVEELDRPLPVLVDVGSLVHLATSLEGRLQRGVSLAELAAAIAPTAAVSGVPRKEALALLEEREPWRGRYGGLTGLVDPRGDGMLYLAIRGIQVHPGYLEVMAGAGVVADSVPERERQEIQAKVDAVVRALVAR